VHPGRREVRRRHRARLLRAREGDPAGRRGDDLVRGGSGERTARYLALNIGTVVLGQTTKRKPDYFGRTVGAYPGASAKPAARDGVYTGGVIAAERSGKPYLVRGDTARITLAGGRTRGTFKSTVLFGGGAVSGTFSCR